ncbi:ABC transporter ATP-binding protein [Pedosphaera parvula]|uniref:ABC transporter related-protein n=1 Tax=Pedosphaera parvula (strain Ellin514) TaxID=320771 RepID=B9XHB8_PEDPL|nr:ATP-binding cassette domain-containing protein [Pedosphaera parvula]EEF60753.1 ABC transporter related-protein [Pedosphaera parvula Ellin514]
MPVAETIAQTTNRPAPSQEVVIAVRGLTKVFKDFWGRPKARAVDNVNFEVRRGEVFGLLGPNGSGKSTTVKMLLGLLYPTKGHIEVFNHSPRHVATKSRIGYLPEESYLYRYLNSHETLDFFGNLFRLPGAEREKRAEQLLEMVGLSQTRTRAVGEFSKGMQRRIGLAQALINDPDLVILDEPTAGLDPIGCREVKDLILALARRGKTVILSSHLLSDVEDVCDRVVIYYGGRIQAMGTLQELLAKPDAVRITAPVLPRATMERVLEIIRKDVDESNVRIDNPTQNLESYFLDVVQKARQAAEETSGATSGHKVADYLRGDAEGKPATDKILERLTSSQASSSAPVISSVPQPVEAVDTKKLEALTLPKEPTPQPPAPAKVDVEKTKAELEKANEKLSSLLGNPGKDK